VDWIACKISYKIWTSTNGISFPFVGVKSLRGYCCPRNIFRNGRLFKEAPKRFGLVDCMKHNKMDIFCNECYNKNRIMSRDGIANWDISCFQEPGKAKQILINNKLKSYNLIALVVIHPNHVITKLLVFIDRLNCFCKDVFFFICVYWRWMLFIVITKLLVFIDRIYILKITPTARSNIKKHCMQLSACRRLFLFMFLQRSLLFPFVSIDVKCFSLQ